MSPARVPYKSSTLGVFWAFGVFRGLYKKTTFGSFVLLEFFVGCTKVKLFSLWAHTKKGDLFDLDSCFKTLWIAWTRRLS